MFRTTARSLVLISFFLVSPTWAGFSGLASDAFSYCYADADNIQNEGCSDSEFSLTGNCSASCGVPGAQGEVSGSLPWAVDGEALWFIGDAGDRSVASVLAERSTAEILTLTVTCVFLPLDSPGPPEVALFRFDGDPSVFDGTSAFNVIEFVDLELIAPEDVLFVQDCTEDGPVTYDVDVTGIPDEELIVFAAAPSGRGALQEILVPALSITGAAVLASLLFGVGAMVLRSRL